MTDFTNLLEKLGDVSKPLRHRDLRALSDLGGESEQAVLRAWRPIVAERRRALVKAMNDLAEDNVEFDFRDILYAVLADDDAAVREAAVDGLWEDERLRTFRRLLSLLTADPESEVRAAVALALGRWAQRAALEELAEGEATVLRTALMEAASVTNPDRLVRRRAVESIGYFNGGDVTETIAAAYGSGERPFKESALVAIGHNLDERWLPVIQAELGSGTAALRYEAARAAGEFSEAAASLVPGLLKLVEDEDTEVATAAVWALGQIGGRAARQMLERLARDSAGVLTQAAEEALDELRFNEDASLI